MSSSDLYIRDEDGNYRIASANDIIDRAKSVIGQRFRAGSPTLTAPARTREFLRMQLATREHEIFAALFLDNRHRLIEYVELFRGTIDGASVHPREVVKEALVRNAAAVIFAHNHPSGVAEPSQADELITRRLRDALALIDIRVLDHIIIGDSAILSFAERGLL
jgi:DNA repair protein RadC